MHTPRWACLLYPHTARAGVLALESAFSPALPVAMLLSLLTLAQSASLFWGVDAQVSNAQCVSEYAWVRPSLVHHILIRLNDLRAFRCPTPKDRAPASSRHTSLFLASGPRTVRQLSGWSTLRGDIHLQPAVVDQVPSSDQFYLGPQEPSDCACNTVMYSLLTACERCQFAPDVSLHELP